MCQNCQRVTSARSASRARAGARPPPCARGIRFGSGIRQTSAPAGASRPAAAPRTARGDPRACRAGPGGPSEGSSGSRSRCSASMRGRRASPIDAPSIAARSVFFLEAAAARVWARCLYSSDQPKRPSSRRKEKAPPRYGGMVMLWNARTRHFPSGVPAAGPRSTATAITRPAAPNVTRTRRRSGAPPSDSTKQEDASTRRRASAASHSGAAVPPWPLGATRTASSNSSHDTPGPWMSKITCSPARQRLRDARFCCPGGAGGRDAAERSCDGGSGGAGAPSRAGAGAEACSRSPSLADTGSASAARPGATPGSGSSAGSLGASMLVSVAGGPGVGSRGGGRSLHERRRAHIQNERERATFGHRETGMYAA